MTLGARVVGPELAESLVRIWLDSEFRAAPRPARWPRSPPPKRASGRELDPSDRLTLAFWRPEVLSAYLGSETADRGERGLQLRAAGSLGAGSARPHRGAECLWPARLSSVASESVASLQLWSYLDSETFRLATAVLPCRCWWRLEAVERSAEMLNDLFALATDVVYWQAETDLRNLLARAKTSSTRL